MSLSDSPFAFGTGRVDVFAHCFSSSPAAKRNLKPTPIAASPPNAHFTTQTDMQAATPDQQEPSAAFARPPTPGTSRKRKAVNPSQVSAQKEIVNIAASGGVQAGDAPDVQEGDIEQATQEPKPKKSRTNTVQSLPSGHMSRCALPYVPLLKLSANGVVVSSNLFLVTQQKGLAHASRPRYGYRLV